MAYTEELSRCFKPYIAVATTTAGVEREMDIGASSADHGEFIAMRPCVVRRLKFTLVGEAASGTTTPPTVIFTKRLTPLSATGEAVMGTLTIPSGTAIGKTIYKDIDPVEFAVGQSMEISHTIGVGTPTGQGVPEVHVELLPDEAGNNANMIASA